MLSQAASVSKDTVESKPLNNSIKKTITTSEEGGFSYSTPLKMRLVAYFRKYYDLDIKDEEADLFLNSLAALYDALSKAELTRESRSDAR